MTETGTKPYETTGEENRSAEEIRQNIVAKGEDLAETVEEVSERIQEKLDWRSYVGQSPYLALGLAAGAGLLASRMMPRPPTTLERITGTIGEEMGNRVSNLLRGVGKSALRSSLWGLALTFAVGLAKRKATEVVLGAISGETSKRPQSASRERKAA